MPGEQAFACQEESALKSEPLTLCTATMKGAALTSIIDRLKLKTFLSQDHVHTSMHQISLVRLRKKYESVNLRFADAGAFYKFASLEIRFPVPEEQLKALVA